MSGYSRARKARSSGSGVALRQTMSDRTSVPPGRSRGRHSASARATPMIWALPSARIVSKGVSGAGRAAMSCAAVVIRPA